MLQQSALKSLVFSLVVLSAFCPIDFVGNALAQENPPRSVQAKKKTLPVKDRRAQSKPREKKRAGAAQKNALRKPAKPAAVTVAASPALRSLSALVFDQDVGNALYQKNADAVVPIASITKLMTAMVVLDAAPGLATDIVIADADVDYLRGSRSRLSVGATISREEALLLALMSSENRAASALARHYPGGASAFVEAMNAKAQSLGMRDTHFLDATGLNSGNVSTALDLAKMVTAAYRYPLIREFSTKAGASVSVSGRELHFQNTNPLVKSSAWEVGLSKTGYIMEAGKCLVMQAWVANRPVVIVLLDSIGKLTRVGDANRIKRWMEGLYSMPKPATHAASFDKAEGVAG